MDVKNSTISIDSYHHLLLHHHQRVTLIIKNPAFYAIVF